MELYIKTIYNYIIQFAGLKNLKWLLRPKTVYANSLIVLFLCINLQVIRFKTLGVSSKESTLLNAVTIPFYHSSHISQKLLL